MGLDYSARNEVQQMIQTALQGERKSNGSNNGQGSFTRNGSVQYYDDTTGIATVLVDGDSYASQIINAMPVVPSVGQRVSVLFQDPHGAQINGILGFTPADAPAEMKANSYFYSPGGGQSASTTGNNGFGTYTIDVDSMGILIATASVHTQATAVQEFTMAPVGSLLGASYSDRSAGISNPERLNTVGLYYQSLSAGASWTPTLSFTVGTGPTNVTYDALSGIVFVIPNTQLQN